jgi:hypothetical protein
VRGGSTVIQAMRDGRVAAAAIHRALTGKLAPLPPERAALEEPAEVQA